MNYSDKKSFYVAILWTVIAMVIVVFWILTRSSRKSQKTSPPRIRISPAVSPRNQGSSRIPKTVVITLNEIFLSSDPSMKLMGTMDFLGQLASKVTDLYLIYTIPAELVGGDEVPESVEKCLAEIIENTKLLGFRKHRLLFTNTRDGRISVCRQLQAELTVDPEPDLVDQLQGKVPGVVCVATNSDFTQFFRKFFC